ncbi:MAG TPA: ABC transporter permease [Ruminococcaceae bacterium]|nr:ABC transporter permease [Oscillospiraceae bacterium]
MDKIKKILGKDLELSILIGITLVVLIAAAAAFGGSMYSGRNIQSMAFQIPEFGFFALAMMLSNMVGGIDLSIIANANTVAIFTAYILNGTWSFGTEGAARVLLAVTAAVITSLAFGVFNGFIIAKTSAPSLIATLGTMTFIQGIGMALTGGSSVGNIDPAFAEFGKAVFLGLPVIFWIFLAASVILGVIISFTGLGRKLYLYGGNPVAARFSAINNEKMSILVFMTTGLLAGMAGLIILSRVNSAKVGYGDSYLLQTMIVCVIGGISPNGGKGKVQGVIIAIILMQVMSSAFTIMSLSPYTKKLIWGIMLIAVLGLNFAVTAYSQHKTLKQSMKNLQGALQK